MQFLFFSSILSIILSVFNVFGITEIGDNSNIINIPDNNFRSCLNEHLGQNTSDDITEEQMTGITDRVRCDNKNITSIEGAEYLTGIKRLYLNENQINSLKPINSLTNLERLFLRENKISDLTPLSNLNNLQRLYLKGNNISDIGALDNLTKLKYLTLSDQVIQLEDITTDADMYSFPLEIINVDKTIVNYLSLNEFAFTKEKVNEINNTWNTAFILNEKEQVFSGTVTQTVIYEKINQEVNIPDNNFRGCLNSKLGQETDAPITESQLLEMSGTLNCNLKEIANIEGAQYLMNVTRLYLGHNDISDVTPLSNLVNLNVLNLGFNNISNINTFSNLTNLTYLYLNNNNISNIDAFSNLVSLNGLYLNGNNISNLEPLSNLNSLVNLYLKYNSITNLEPLKNLDKLIH